MSWGDAYRLGYRVGLGTQTNDFTVTTEFIEAYWHGYCAGQTTAARRELRRVAFMRNERTKS
jgi:hypothetical protein